MIKGFTNDQAVSAWDITVTLALQHNPFEAFFNPIG